MSNTILLIEDKPGLLDTVQNLLELHDYKVITATNGKEGIELAKSHHPDLVISDIYMPVLNGYQLLEQFQLDETLCKIPVIILSAKTGEEEVNLAYQKGAAGYLTKPFLFTSLHEQIKKLLI
ncbi:Response regulator receiver domain-containing protein [Chitinophaga sp. CF118]|uniref:response regulator n=1 Tax=Chitinophaga sp. CF118 TaxID=1884367 RepID=UPI0008EF6C55|nr:response regulator [Chitinophaga sp. CF118]SFE03397.1 Response regulator receiver domain-containing protein [Chitinophaga sp. CF118]